MSSSFRKKTISTVLISSLLMLPVPALATTQNAAMNSNPLLLTRIDDSEIAKVLTQTETVTIGNKSADIHYVLVPKTSGLVSDVAVAQNNIGQTDELGNLATQNDAVAAINGGFFQSFDTSKPMDPYGVLIKDGKLIHTGDLSGVIGFTEDNTLKIGIMAPVVTATVSKKTVKVDQLNHTPSRDGSAVSVFSRARGNKIGFSYGTNVIVTNGEITEITDNHDVAIPAGGYIINLTGDAIEQWKDTLAEGAKVSFNVSYVNENGSKSDWSGIKTAIGAGPILLRNGAVAINLAKENFTNEKSTTMSFARSAVGVNEDGNILLVSGVNSTLEQMADVMLQLGAVEAISMDSGSSSGLYANDQYVVKSSRAMSNALIFKVNND